MKKLFKNLMRKDSFSEKSISIVKTCLSLFVILLLVTISTQILTQCTGQVTFKAGGSGSSGGAGDSSGNKKGTLKTGCEVITNGGKIDIDGVGDSDLAALADGYTKAIKQVLTCIVCPNDFEANKANLGKIFWKEGTLADGSNWAKKWTTTDGRDRIDNEKTPDGKEKRIMHLVMDFKLIKKTLDDNKIPYSDECAYNPPEPEPAAVADNKGKPVPPRPTFTKAQTDGQCYVITDGEISVQGMGKSDMEALSDGYIKAIKQTLMCYLCDDYNKNYDALAKVFWKEGVFDGKVIYAKKWTKPESRDRITDSKTPDGVIIRHMNLIMDLDLIWEQLFRMNYNIKAPCASGSGKNININRPINNNNRVNNDKLIRKEPPAKGNTTTKEPPAKDSGSDSKGFTPPPK